LYRICAVAESALRRSAVHFTRESPGRDAVNLLELARQMRLVEEARHVSNIRQLCSGANELPRARYAHLSQVGLRSQPRQPMEHADEMGCVQTGAARQSLGIERLRVLVVDDLTRRVDSIEAASRKVRVIELAFSDRPLRAFSAATAVRSRARTASNNA